MRVLFLFFGGKMKKISIFGDSISTDPILKSLVEKKLSESGIDAKVDIFAVPGESSKDGLKRLYQVVQGAYDLNIVFFGANDAAIHYNVSPSEFVENLQRIASTLGPDKTSIVTVPYLNEKLTSKYRSNEQVAKYVEAEINAFKDSPVNIIDLNKAMLETKNPDKLIIDDGLHFTEAGYQLLSDLITENIRKKVE